MSRVVRLQPRRRPNTALADALIGMAWWNGLAPSECAAWLDQARTACPADCWNAYKNGALLEEGGRS